VSNKITGIDGNRAAPVGPGRAVERARDAATGTKGAAEGAAGVAITDTARQLAELEQALASQPAVDEVRVASLRAQIEQGRYTVSAERIADQLLQLERALGPLKG
jgi:negative regulator of flagellin synthesis FlgM